MSNNIFQDVLKDSSSVENKLMGPSYSYVNNIRTPLELGMSDRGDFGTLARDINGLVNYVDVLVTGNGAASRTGRPLGNKFFLKTGGKCVDKVTKQEVDRYIYINNVPQGNIPIITNGMGQNFSQFKGLIPGVISNLNVLNPYAIMQSFLIGSKPECQAITMQTIDVNNIPSVQTHFVATIDVQNTDPCSFLNGINPANGKRCIQGFQNQNNQLDNASPVSPSLPDDIFVQLYFASLSILSIYILYRLVEKKY